MELWDFYRCRKRAVGYPLCSKGLPWGRTGFKPSTSQHESGFVTTILRFWMTKHRIGAKLWALHSCLCLQQPSDGRACGPTTLSRVSCEGKMATPLLVPQTRPPGPKQLLYQPSLQARGFTWTNILKKKELIFFVRWGSKYGSVSSYSPFHLALTVQKSRIRTIFV